MVDPRTGEILKGHVSLGSLRVRQDYLIAEGLLAPYVGADAGGFAAADDPMLALALARLRQLSAHEVGHTIGLAHNFAGSTQGRTTVMDYPAPLATLVDGAVDVADAYAVGVGPWDVQAVRYGYARSDAEADRVLAENRARGLRYVTDADARPTGAATPTGALWDNGSDAVRALDDEMAVRRAALDRFGEATDPPGPAAGDAGGGPGPALPPPPVPGRRDGPPAGRRRLRVHRARRRRRPARARSTGRPSGPRSGPCWRPSRPRRSRSPRRPARSRRARRATARRARASTGGPA